MGSKIVVWRIRCCVLLIKNAYTVLWYYGLEEGERSQEEGEEREGEEREGEERLSPQAS